MASPGNWHCANCIGALIVPYSSTYLLTHFVTCWRCSRSGVYETVRSPSVCLSVPAWALSSKPAPAGLLAGRRYRSQILQQRRVNAGRATSSAYVQGFI